MYVLLKLLLLKYNLKSLISRRSLQAFFAYESFKLEKNVFL